jgi:hypothetical protein
MGAALSCLLLLAGAATGSDDRIYRSVDAEGRVVFSDQPPSDDAKPLELPPLMIVEPTVVVPPPRPQRTERPQPPYRTLAIVSPAHDEAVRSNVGDVAIRVRVEPALQPGHRLQLLLDGEVVDGSGTGGVFQLSNVHRGTHVAQARVVDGDGHVVKTSDAISFHMLQISVLTRPR